MSNENNDTDLTNPLTEKGNEPGQARNKPGPKPKAKPGRPPEKKEAGSPSRISYKDRNKISHKGRDKDFHYRIVNTDNERNTGRIDYMKSIGYIMVEDGTELGDDHGVEAGQIGSASKKHVGHGTHGVLMKIPKEYYEEDQAAKQAQVDDTEQGMVADELRDGDNLYGEGLKISDAKGTRLETRVRK